MKPLLYALSIVAGICTIVISVLFVSIIVDTIAGPEAGRLAFAGMSLIVFGVCAWSYVSR